MFNKHVHVSFLYKTVVRDKSNFYCTPQRMFSTNIFIYLLLSDDKWSEIKHFLIIFIHCSLQYQLLLLTRQSAREKAIFSTCILLIFSITIFICLYQTTDCRRKSTSLPSAIDNISNQECIYHS